jgi:hypothetical protein
MEYADVAGGMLVEPREVVCCDVRLLLEQLRSSKQPDKPRADVEQPISPRDADLSVDP